jgi:hypothetical protein
MAYTHRFLTNGFVAATGPTADITAPDIDARIVLIPADPASGVTSVAWKVDGETETVPTDAVYLACQVGDVDEYRVATGLVAAAAGSIEVRVSLPQVVADTTRNVRFAWLNAALEFGSFSEWQEVIQPTAIPAEPEVLTFVDPPLLTLDPANPLVVGTIVGVSPGTAAGGVPPYSRSSSIQSADDDIGTGLADDAHIPGDPLLVGLEGKYLRAKVVVTDSAATSVTAYSEWTTSAVYVPDPPGELTITSWRWITSAANEYLAVFNIDTADLDPADYTGLAGTWRAQWARLPANPNASPSWEILSPYNYAEGQEAAVAGSTGEWRCNTTSTATTGNWIRPNRRMPVYRPTDTYPFLLRYSADGGANWSPAVQVDPNTESPIFPWLTVGTPETAYWKPVDRDAGTTGDHYGCGHQFVRGLAASGSTLYGFGDMCGIRVSPSFGGDWEAVEGTGLDAFAFNTGAVDPDDPNRVIAIAHAAWLHSTAPYSTQPGIWLSTDGMDTAAQAHPLTTGATGGHNNTYHQRTVCFDPLGPATPATRTWYYMDHRSGYGSQLMRSVNGGTTWASVGAALSSSQFGLRVWQMAMNTATADRFYLGASNGVWTKTSPTGAWSRLGTGLPQAECRSIATDGATIYASIFSTDTAQRGVWKSTNSGSTWTRVLNQNIMDLAVNWNSATEVVVARRIVASGENRLTDIYVSTNGGSSFTTNKPRTPVPGDSNISLSITGIYSGIIAHPTVADVFLLVASSGRIFKSVDGGETWSGTATKGFTGYNASLQNVCLHVHPTTPGRFDFGIEDHGHVSITGYGAGGLTGSNINNTRPSPTTPTGQRYWSGARASARAACTLRSGRVIMSVGGNSQLLFRKQPGATAWTPGAFTGSGVTSPQNNSPSTQAQYDTMCANYVTAMGTIDCIREHPVADNVVWAGPFKSTDGGANWVKQAQSMVDMHPDGTGFFTNSSTTIYRSTNWHTSSPTFTEFYQSPVSLHAIGLFWCVFRADPFSNTKGYTMGAGRDLVRVSNTGGTFGAAVSTSYPLFPETGLSSAEYRIASLAPSFNTDGMIYISHAWGGCSNLWRGQITGSAVAWTDITANAPKWPLNMIDVHPETDDVFLSGGFGIWCYPPPTPESTSVWDNLVDPITVPFSDNTLEPVFTGTPQVVGAGGQTGVTTAIHSVAEVDVSGSPAPELTYSWRTYTWVPGGAVADPDNALEVATTLTFQPDTDIISSGLFCRVTATNSEGEAVADTLGIEIIPALELSSVVISPAFGEAGTLFSYVADGILSGATITQQWKRDGANISGATASTYLATTDGALSVLVTATIGSISVSLESPTVAVISSDIFGVTQGGAGTNTASYSAPHGAYATGDLMLMVAGIEDQTRTITLPTAGPNGEPIIDLGASFTTALAGVTGRVFAWIGNATMPAGTVLVSTAAPDNWATAGIRFPAATFAATSPIDKITTAGNGTASTSGSFPAFAVTNANATVVTVFLPRNNQIATVGAGWHANNNWDSGSVTTAVATRNALTTAAETVAALPITFGTASTWVAVSIAVNAPGTPTITQVPFATVLPLASVASGLLGEEGNAISVTTGTWLHSPTTAAYRWLRGTAAIGGATASSYTPVAADVGTVLTPQVQRTNSIGTSAWVSASNPVTIVDAPDAPTIATLSAQSYAEDSGTKTYNIGALTTGTTPITYGLAPEILGLTVVDNGNRTYTATGFSAGTPAPTFSYQWTVDGVNDGTDSDTFDNNTERATGSLTVTVTATNAHNSDQESSSNSIAITPNLGPEMVTNGTFVTNTTGWGAANAAVLSVVSGRMRLTGGGGTNGQARQTVTAILPVVGRSYRVSAEIYPGTSIARTLRVGTSTGGTQYGTLSTTGFIDIVATSTVLMLTCNMADTTVGNYAEYDNISVKEFL